MAGIIKVDNIDVISGGKVTTAGMPTGSVLKKTFYSIGRGTMAASAFPNDDTIPQRTEGAEIFSQAYTPSTTSCNIMITTYIRLGEASNVDNAMQLGLFISDSDDALVVAEASPGDINPNGGNITIMHSMSGWSGAKTFSLRSSNLVSIFLKIKWKCLCSVNFSLS